MKGPSQKIILLFASSIVAIGGVWYVSQIKDGKPTPSNIESNTSNASLQALIDTGTLSNKDSDKDGLLDWEETVWGLDLDKAYSNGKKNPDGSPMTDSEYAKQQASSSPAIENSSGLTGVEGGPVTQTGKLGQDIYNKYLALKQQGLPIDNAAKQKLIQDAINDNPYPSGKTYVISDIKIGGTETPSSLRSYGNAIGDSVLKNSPIKPQQGDAAIVFRDATQAKDPEKLKNLDPIIQAYRGILKDLLSMTVTKGVSEKHLALINAVSLMLNDIESMRTIFDDPALGLIGAKSYAKTSFNFYWNIKGLAEYFKARGVVFGKNDGGYGFQVIVQ